MDYLRGFLADLSHDSHIQNALSLFQFVPKSFVALDSNADNTNDVSSASIRTNTPVYDSINDILNNRKIIRIESGTYVNNGRFCAAFRDCDTLENSGFCGSNTEFCYRQDSLVGVFAYEGLRGLNPFGNQYFGILQSIVSKVNKTLDHGIKVIIERAKGKKHQRCYLHYTCPQSLFEEHIFPIYAKGSIVACLMLGQMARDAFMEDKTFCQYRSVMCSKNSSLFTSSIDVLPKEKWLEKEKTIIERIELFEKRLEDRINHRSANYLHFEFDRIEERFQANVKTINVKESYTFDRFFYFLSIAFTEICKITDSENTGFIRMFAIPIDSESHKLLPIGWSNSSNVDYFKLTQDYYFDSDVVTSGDLIDSASIKLQMEYQHGDGFQTHSLVGDKISFIVWKRDPELLLVESQKDAFNAYENNLQSFFKLAMQSYAFIRGARLEFMLETTIRTTAHESAHFILPALDVVKNKLEVIPDQMVLSAYAEEYHEYCKTFYKQKDDVISALQLLDNINSRPSMIFKPLELQKENKELFPLLLRMVMMMSARAKDNNIYIVLSQKWTHSLVNVDSTYICHALFNLLDNAIKYAYEGSNIFVTMEPDKSRNSMIIEISNYGIPIKDGERIYELFFRGSTALEKNRSGMGIGMFLVKKICEAHGGTIKHSSEKISDMNVPVLFAFPQKQSLARDLDTLSKQSCKDECDRLSTIKKSVVYKSSFVKYPNVFQGRLYQPTYNNIFTIQLPLL